MTYEFKLSCALPASPEAVYDAWLDSERHSAMTGAPAKIGKRVGDPYAAWDGYIAGKTLELVPGRRIVQSWRTSEFSHGDPDSTITVELEPTKTGTRLTLTHSGVPDDQTDYEKGGWRDFYFSPMKAYFSRESRNAKLAKKRPKTPSAQSSPSAPEPGKSHKA
jgi:activator of HSP90 ATPase